MPVTLSPQGKADWTDYQDYWRDDDAEWLQERSVLRYATSAARDAQWTTPSPGQVIYNQFTDQLEHFAATSPTKWIGVLASQHLGISPKTTASDNDPAVLGHKGAGGGGIQFFPTISSENKIALTTNAYLDIGLGAIVAKPGGLTVTAPTALGATTFKTGAKTVALSTDADALVFDSKIEAPDAAFAAMSLTGTFAGGVSSIVNANSGTIGGVTLASASVSAPSGYVSSAGYFFGSGTQARIRQRDTASPFTLGTAGFDITDISIMALGTYFDMSTQPRVFGARSTYYYSGASGAAAGTLLGYGGPVIYSASDPGAANYPNGTIWFS